MKRARFLLIAASVAAIVLLTPSFAHVTTAATPATPITIFSLLSSTPLPEHHTEEEGITHTFRWERAGLNETYNAIISVWFRAGKVDSWPKPSFYMMFEASISGMGFVRVSTSGEDTIRTESDLKKEFTYSKL